MAKLKLILFFFVFITLTGCSSSIAYNNINWLLYWYLDDYVELDKAQKQLLDVRIGQWHHWHRTEELAKYKQQLVSLRQQLNSGPLSQQQWLAQFAQGRQHWSRFRDQLSPELSKLALSLNDEQITNLFEVLEEENQKESEELSELTEKELIEERQERIEEQIKDNIGRLSSQQKSIIAEFVPQFKSTMSMWVEYRRAIQSQARELMLRRHQVENFAIQLDSLIRDPEKFKSPAYIAASDHNRALFAQLAARINTTLSDKQKRKLDNKIEDLIEVIDDLIND